MPDLKSKEISRVLSGRWKALPDEERQVYQNRYKQARAEYVIKKKAFEDGPLKEYLASRSAPKNFATTNDEKGAIKRSRDEFENGPSQPPRGQETTAKPVKRDREIFESTASATNEVDNNKRTKITGDHG